MYRINVVHCARDNSLDIKGVCICIYIYCSWNCTRIWKIREKQNNLLLRQKAFQLFPTAAPRLIQRRINFRMVPLYADLPVHDQSVAKHSLCRLWSVENQRGVFADLKLHRARARCLIANQIDFRPPARTGGTLELVRAEANETSVINQPLIKSAK